MSKSDRTVRLTGNDANNATTFAKVKVPNMTGRTSPRIGLENFVSPGRVVQVDAAKYQAMKTAILAVLPSNSPGRSIAELMEKLLPRLSQEQFPGGAKAGWWLKAVQLDLEAKGIIARENTKPLRLHRRAH